MCQDFFFILKFFFTETSQFRIPQSLRGPRPTSSSRLDQQNVNITAVGEIDNDNDMNSHVFVFGSSNEQPDISNASQELTESNVNANENSLNETLEISAISRRIEQEVENDDVQSETLIDGDVEDDNEDDFEDEEDAEDEEDEMNTTFIEEDEISSTFNVEFDGSAQNVISQVLNIHKIYKT